MRSRTLIYLKMFGDSLDGLSCLLKKKDLKCFLEYRGMWLMAKLLKEIRVGSGICASQDYLVSCVTSLLASIAKWLMRARLETWARTKAVITFIQASCKGSTL
jgi:hypothetical protein